jgi:ABC-type multidrug transport system ATPase subunit
MMTLAGFLRPDAGEINLLNRGPFSAEHHAGRISILPQDSELPIESTPKDALYRFGRLQGLSPAAARKSARDALAAVNLADRANATVRTLSHGMRKRAMVAQCFIGNPEIVLLDEPLNGLDPVEADRLRRFIASQRGRRTIVVSSHNLEDVERLCTHVAVIGSGRLVRMDTISAITHETDRIAYSLSSAPKDPTAVTSALKDADFEWKDGGRTLICSFDQKAGGVAEINCILLPALLSQTSIISVTPGQSLEEAFLVTGTAGHQSPGKSSVAK